MRSEKFDFIGAQGQRLAGRLDAPVETPRATALFAHCFTCGKDILAASRITAALAKLGIATLRFDFTGLGASEGEFGNGGFSADVADLAAAADALAAAGMPPALVIGHSLGGAAVLAAASSGGGAIAQARAVVTIAAPFEAAHVLALFGAALFEIEARGEAQVQLAGRPFTIRRRFVEDLRAQDQAQLVARLRKPLLIFHSPVDATVGIDNAARIFQHALHPKSFISLADADHLLSRRSDADYVAGLIAAWVTRYLPA